MVALAPQGFAFASSVDDFDIANALRPFQQPEGLTRAKPDSLSQIAHGGYDCIVQFGLQVDTLGQK